VRLRWSRLVTVRGAAVSLTPTEWGILLALAGVPGRVYSRFELINRVRGYEFEGYERTVDSHVKNLRRKIEADPANPEIVQTVLRGEKMPTMSHTRGSLLAQIEAVVLDDTVPLSSLLQKCIVLGGRAGSEKMRDWTRRELNGYEEDETVPKYRRLPAVLMVVITNSAGHNGRSVRLDPAVFPTQVHDMLRKKDMDLNDAVLSGGIGELEALAKQETDEHRFLPSFGGFIAYVLNDQHMVAPNSRAAEVYWSVSSASIRGLLVRVRTALAELIAELISLTPQDQEVPDKLAADQAVQFVITGDRTTINYSPQHAGDGGTNVSIADVSVPGSVTVSGAHGSAIGSQNASGPNSSVVGSQSAQAGRDTVTAGRDATVEGTKGQDVKEGWWARLRKRGAVVAFATIISAIAAVVGTIVGVCVWLGWTP
jgi:hypothetical protein